VLPSYLNALAGKGVHVVTVNDYLARRDSEWVGQVPRFLGMQVSRGGLRQGEGTEGRGGWSPGNVAKPKGLVIKAQFYLNMQLELMT
jgi:hypothetical protein